MTTGNDGNFMFDHSIGYLIARGGHDIRFTFEGQTFYLPVEYNMTVFARADVIIEVLWQTDIIIRSNDAYNIEVVGRIVEVGGEGNVIEEMDVVLVWNGAAESSTVMWDDSTRIRLISMARRCGMRRILPRVGTQWFGCHNGICLPEITLGR